MANLLVGNDEGAATLEAALLGPELLFRKPAIVAVAGGEATPKLNGQVRPRNESFAVQAGDRLSFHQMKLGARPYIARSRRIDVPAGLWHRVPRRPGGFGRLRRPQ